MGRWPANVVLDEGAAALIGEVSRYFYTSKASRSERERGLEHITPERRTDGRTKDIENPRLRTSERANGHPTVKSLSLMRWLCRLVTPPGGVVLDPFLGSGTTIIAALKEGFSAVGIEIGGHYCDIAINRIEGRGKG